MGFFTKQKVPVVDRRRSLDSIPVINPHINMETDAEGRILLTAKIEPRNSLVARFMIPELVKRVRLDELGTFVVQQIDGERNVLEIIDRFIQRYGANRREAELSTVDFLKSLLKRRIISVVVK